MMINRRDLIKSLALPPLALLVDLDALATTTNNEWIAEIHTKECGVLTFSGKRNLNQDLIRSVLASGITIHNSSGAAFTSFDKIEGSHTVEFWEDGCLHCDFGPAVIKWNHGSDNHRGYNPIYYEAHLQKGLLHNIFGPAIVFNSDLAPTTHKGTSYRHYFYYGEEYTSILQEGYINILQMGNGPKVKLDNFGMLEYYARKMLSDSFIKDR